MSVQSYVYIAYDHKGTPISGVLAKSSSLARAYWQGKGIIPHSEREIEMLDDHPTGVIPLFSTHDMTNTELRGKKLDFAVKLISAR